MVTDLAFLKETTSDNNESIHRLIKMYIEQAACLVETIKRSYDGKDWKKMDQAAHTLRGMLHYMGVEAIKNDVKVIETHANQKQDAADLPALIARVEKICSASIEELKNYLKENPLT